MKILGIPSLELRPTRGDLIEMYKILTGKEDIDQNQLLRLSSNIHSTREHHLKLFKKPCRINVRNFFFSHRVVDDWNSLPSNIVGSPSVNTFKNRLDDYFTMNGRLQSSAFQVHHVQVQVQVVQERRNRADLLEVFKK